MGEETTLIAADSAPRDRSTEGYAVQDERLGQGRLVGRYVVLEEVGVGGMGIVYAAYDPKLGRKVAIKLLHRSLPDAKRNVARLLREAQAMARLNHPHVVTVHDVGDHDGQVFIAMEFVEGKTLETWLKAAPRTWEEVLPVFVQAAQGLAAAHGVGLVHRDFKPDNVMVGDDGRVLVMDFGLARSAEAQAAISLVGRDAQAQVMNDSTGELAALPTVASQVTAAGSLIGTPAYMSPEQFGGDEVGPASDQFSFCASLYRALYDQRPFPGSSLAELAASVRAGRLQDPPEDKKVPAWLAAALTRGLQVDPARRHASMNDLLTALAAGRRRGRRRLYAVGGGASVLLATTIGWAAMSGPPVCSSGEERFAEVWNPERAASIEAAFGELGLPYAPQTWQRAKPALEQYARRWAQAYYDACAATRIEGQQSERRLDARMDCLQSQRGYVDALLAEWAHPDPDIVERTIAVVSRLPAPERCAEPDRLDETEVPPEQREQVDRARDLKARAEAKKAAGRYDEGLRLVEQALAELDGIELVDLRAELLQHQASLVASTGDHSRAHQLYQSALREAAKARNHRLMAGLWQDLLYERGLQQGDRAYGKVAAEAARVSALAAGEDAALQWALEDKLGILLRMDGQYDRAEEHGRRAVELATEHGADATSMEVVYTNLGNTLYEAGKHVEAREILERALELSRQTYGDEHPSTAIGHSNLARVCEDQGDLDCALSHQDIALSLREKMLGREHPDYADSLYNTSNARQGFGELELAEQGIREAMRIWERAYGARSERMGIGYNTLGTVVNARGDKEQALEYYELAEDIFREVLGDQHPRVATPMSNRGNTLRELERYEEALALHRQALALREGGVAADHPDLPYPLIGVAEDLLALGRAAEAIPYCERALAIRQKHQVEDSLLGAAYFMVAWARWDANDDRERAIEMARRAKVHYDKSPMNGNHRPDVEQWLAERDGTGQTSR